MEGSGKGATLFAGVLLEGLLSVEPEEHGEEGSGDRQTFSVGAPLGNLVGCLSTGPCVGPGDGYFSP